MYSVLNAGLGIGIGIGSSFIVLVSFVWGVFIFQEDVRSKLGACLAIVCMIVGLMGMSYYSSPPANDISDNGTSIPGSEVEIAPRLSNSPTMPYHDLDTEDTYCEDPPETTATDSEEVGLEEVDEEGEDMRVLDEGTIFVCGVPFSRRHRGMLAAMFCGVWGGSVLAPMKWAGDEAQGTGFLLSFAIGASLVTISLWIIRYIWNVIHFRSFVTAYLSLPSFHLRVMWFQGGLSGTLWSIGNFFSLISVLNLGEGVGYPLSQMSILVSGLWGIFYFKEVTGKDRISKWLSSSLLTIFGIILLSYEHVAEENEPFSGGNNNTVAALY